MTSGAPPAVSAPPFPPLLAAPTPAAAALSDAALELLLPMTPAGDRVPPSASVVVVGLAAAPRNARVSNSTVVRPLHAAVARTATTSTTASRARPLVPIDARASQLVD
jgi:hypothetical protein